MSHDLCCCLDLNCSVGKLFDGMRWGVGQTGHVRERDENNSWIIKGLLKQKERRRTSTRLPHDKKCCLCS